MLTLAELRAMDVGQVVVDHDDDEWKKIDSYSWQCQLLSDQTILSAEDLVMTFQCRRKETHVEQPMPTESSGPSMHSLAYVVLNERAMIGLDRYGQPLQAMNGRDAVRDTIEELADGLAYAMQIREERRLLREELEALAESVAGGEVDERLRGIIDRYFPS